MLKRTRSERWTDWVYSLTYWPFAIGQTPVFFLAAYLNKVSGAPIAVLGLISTIARIYDALFDPVIGVVSDRTRSRAGRRKPWVLIGFIGMIGTLLVAVFALPDKPGGFSAGWFAFGLIFFFTTWTTALVPYAAHAGEITTSYDRRSKMNLQQSTVGLTASLVTYLVPYLLVDHDMFWLRKLVADLLPTAGTLGDLATWLRTSALAGVANYGRVMVVLSWMTIISSPLLLFLYMRYVPELPIPEGEQTTHRFKLRSLLEPMRNPVFTSFCIGYLIFIAGYIGRLSLYPFVIPYATSGKLSFLLIMQIQGVTGILAIPFWSRLYLKLERGQIMMLAAGIEAFGLVCQGLSGAGSDYLSIIGSIAIGLPGGTLYMVPYLIASEAADYTRLRQGGDSRGLHMSIISMIIKIGSFLATLGLTIAGALGFDPSHRVTAHDVMVLKMLGLFGPAVLIMIGGIIMLRFPITRRRHRAIQLRIDRRRQTSETIVPDTRETFVFPYAERAAYADTEASPVK